MNRKKLVIVVVGVCLIPFWQALSQEIKGFTSISPPQIAVFPFEDTNSEAREEGYGKTVSVMLTTALMENPNLQVVEREELTRILKEQQMSLTGIAAKAIEIGKIQGVNAFVFGAVSLLRKKKVKLAKEMTVKEIEKEIVEIDARLIDVESGRIIVSQHVSTPNLIEKLRISVEEIASTITSTYLKPYLGKISIVAALTDPNIKPECDVYYRPIAPTTLYTSPKTINLNEFKFLGNTGEEGKDLAKGDFALLRGDYEIAVVKPGYQTEIKHIRVVPDSTSVCKVELKPQLTTLKVFRVPAFSSIYIEGASEWNKNIYLIINMAEEGIEELVRLTETEASKKIMAEFREGTLFIKNIQTGEYKIGATIRSVSRLGKVTFTYFGWMDTVFISGDVTVLSLPKPEKFGRSGLRIFIKPHASKGILESMLYLDDSYLGLVKYPGEIEVKNLSAGYHTLLLEPTDEAFCSVTKTFSLEDKEFQNLFIEFEEKTVEEAQEKLGEEKVKPKQEQGKQ